MSKQTFNGDYLLQQLCHPAVPVACQVAYSGGLDSHVLLHALCGLRDRLDSSLSAVHIHHGLQAEADQWAQHCRQVCAALGVELTVLSVDAAPSPGESPEAAARRARYDALRTGLPAGHCLLTAHHQDDQAETLLLQLLRGAGVSGLAAMPAAACFGQGQHLRPLLRVTRAALQDYAAQASLHWIEDPSNAALDYDRNYLRHQVMPRLHARWPAAAASLSRSAGHCATADAVIAEVAAADCVQLAGSQPDTLSVTGLCGLSPGRQAQALRYWLQQHGRQLPSTAVLTRLVADLLYCRTDASPCVCWGDHEVRRYRDDLYCLWQCAVPDAAAVLDWSLATALPLPQAGGLLTATPGRGRGLRAAAVGATGVRVAWRCGGERCQPAGRRFHHSLKKLFQAAGIPPWQRNRIPLIYLGDELAMVPGLWVCEPFQAGPQERSVVIDWQAPGKG